jgi:hypothetical protein
MAPELYPPIIVTTYFEGKMITKIWRRSSSIKLSDFCKSFKEELCG